MKFLSYGAVFDWFGVADTLKAVHDRCIALFSGAGRA